MIRAAIRTLAAATVLLIAAPAAALDPLRCEAVALRKDGQRYECLARCQRRQGWRDAAGAAAADIACRQTCEARFAAAMELLETQHQCARAVERLMTREFCAGYARAGEPR